MFTYQKDGVSMKTVLDTRRALQSGLYRVRTRVFYKGKYIEYSTDIKLSLHDWELLPETDDKQLKKIRQEIQRKFDIISKHVEKLTYNESFSFEALNLKLQRTDGETLNSWLKQKIADLTKENRFGSVSYYNNISKAVERYKGDKISFDSVNVNWLKGFELFLLSEKKTFATIGMYIRGIRAIINAAKEKGIVKEFSYPFGKNKYEIPTGESRKLALTVQQVGTVVNFTDGNPVTEKYRDLWYFSYLANGMNFSDILRLKYSDIIDGDIVWYRQKTLHTNRHKKPIQAFLTPEMQTIIKRWGNEVAPDNFIFPYFKDGIEPEREIKVIADVVRRVNRRMKYIGEQTGAGKISTYTARHSFATVLKRSGANVAYISESLGHADIKTTESYLAKFEQSERVKNAALLTDFKTIEK
jgi:integrase/recombinase XerD